MPVDVDYYYYFIYMPLFAFLFLCGLPAVVVAPAFLFRRCLSPSLRFTFLFAFDGSITIDHIIFFIFLRF